MLLRRAPLAFLALGCACATGRDFELPRRRSLLASISVGSPPQELRCFLDSRTSDLWLPSGLCRTCRSRRSLHAQQSSTFSPITEKDFMGEHPRAVALPFEGGLISGYAAQDTVAIGSVEMLNQSFVIVEEAALPEKPPWEGLCGLGWASSALVDRKPLYARLQEQGRPAVFAVVPRSTDAAMLQIGSPPLSSYKPNTLVWVDAKPAASVEGASNPKSGFWVMPGSVVLEELQVLKARFLVDIGSHAILVPSGLFPIVLASLLPNQFFERFCEDTGEITCDCRVAEQKGTRPLRIRLGDRTFSLRLPQLLARESSMRRLGKRESCSLQLRPNPLSAGGGAAPVGGEESETRIVTRMTGGVVCTTTTVIEAGVVRSNETRCGPRATAVPVQAPAAQQQNFLQDSRRLQSEDEGFWVLGAAFMENFVTAFDFDASRVAVAEPLQRPRPALEVLGYNRMRAIPECHKMEDPCKLIKVRVAAGAAMCLAAVLTASLFFGCRRAANRRLQQCGLEPLE